MNLVKFNNGSRSTMPYINNVFDTLFNDSYGISKMPQVNVLETDEAYSIELAVPGLNKTDFSIEVLKETLKISAEKKTENEEVKKTYSRKEFEYTSFTRTFRLPEDADATEITAEYVNGVLCVKVKKAVKEADLKREITVQ